MNVKFDLREGVQRSVLRRLERMAHRSRPKGVLAAPGALGASVLDPCRPAPDASRTADDDDLPF